MSLDAILKLGPIALVAGFAAMILCYAWGRRPALTTPAPSGVRYFAVALMVGILAYLAGAVTGVYGACSSPDSGNLCGLYGLFGLGPLLSGVALLVYGLHWRQRARRER